MNHLASPLNHLVLAITNHNLSKWSCFLVITFYLVQLISWYNYQGQIHKICQVKQSWWANAYNFKNVLLSKNSERQIIKKIEKDYKRLVLLILPPKRITKFCRLFQKKQRALTRTIVCFTCLLYKLGLAKLLFVSKLQTSIGFQIVAQKKIH